jgi:hypothetical protein
MGYQFVALTPIWEQGDNLIVIILLSNIIEIGNCISIRVSLSYDDIAIILSNHMTHSWLFDLIHSYALLMVRVVPNGYYNTLQNNCSCINEIITGEFLLMVSVG